MCGTITSSQLPINVSDYVIGKLPDTIFDPSQIINVETFTFSNIIH